MKITKRMAMEAPLRDNLARYAPVWEALRGITTGEALEITPDKGETAKGLSYGLRALLKKRDLPADVLLDKASNSVWIVPKKPPAQAVPASATSNLRPLANGR